MNPFVGTMPYQGLLVMMLLFANGDLKNSNNSLYEVTRDGATEQWYVVRDLGASLGERGIFKPMRNDPGLFEQESFITGAGNGFVQFDHPMKERMLVEGRITMPAAGGVGQQPSRPADRASMARRLPRGRL